MFRKTTLALIATVALTAQRAPALHPSEVAVVANSASEASVRLARFYAKKRQIPEQNIFLVKTTTAYQVPYVYYQSQIRTPLMKEMLKRKIATKIRALALMYGVPVRMGRATLGEEGHLADDYGAAGRKTHYRLAINFALLSTVGRKFPHLETDQLTPLGKLFPFPSREPASPLTSIPELNKNIIVLLELKQKQLGEIGDPPKKQIVSRQLMGLQLNLYGLNGLIRYITTHRPQGAPDLDDLRKELLDAQRKLGEINAAKQRLSKKGLQERLGLREKIDGIAALSTYIQQKMVEMLPPQSRSAVDNELALMWWREYPFANQLKNPLHWRFAKQFEGKRTPLLMTARIDGPSAEDVRRMIKGSIETEREGLSGTFYIDAGGGFKVRAAAAYDRHLKKLYSFLKTHTKLKVVLDEKPTVFAPQTCPDAALYVGWYSLRQYVPAFIWRKGAVGWHIASFEAEDLRNPNSTRWCTKMIQDGVVGTLGATDEPTLGAFPLPDEFFPLLLTGKYTIAECYWRTAPMVSWRMTLIADPLYNPFAANPQVTLDALPEGLAP